MRWEELKVYRPLTKDKLKDAFKDFTKIIADNLKPFGFSLKGRKLIALSNDLVHVIHIDTRGSWMGVNEYFKTEISIVALSDKSPFLRGFELTGNKGIEDIVVGIRDNYRVTKEYGLLADFLTRKIIEQVVPYFDKYDRSQKLLNDRKRFRLGDMIEKNDALILFCELQSQIDIEASALVEKALRYYGPLYPDKSKLKGYFEELETYREGLATGSWTRINQRIADNKMQVLNKLKI